MTQDTVVEILDSVDARATIEKAAWQRGFMDGNPLNQFKPGPMAGISKLPDLSLALAFENRLGLKGETASATDLLVQTAPMLSLQAAQEPLRASVVGTYPCRSVWTPGPGKEKKAVSYPSDAVRILRDEGRYYLMAIPQYGQYKYDRDFAFEEDQPGKKNPKSVPIYAYSFKSVGNVRSRLDSYIVEEVMDVNKVMKLAREGRIYLYSIDFGKDKWIADIVYTKDNKQPCKIVPTTPVLASVGVAKSDALGDGRKNGTNIETKVSSDEENVSVHLTFTFHPTVSRSGRKYEGRSWASYLDAFPAEAHRTIIRWPDTESLDDSLKRVIETDGVLLTDKEHLDEALRAATYVVKGDPYQGYNLKERIFKDTDGRAEWRKNQSKDEGEESRKKKAEQNAKYETQRKEQKGKPLVEVLSPALAKEAEAEFTRQIEADAISVKVGDAFKEAVAREFRRIAYTGTMGWRQKLNRPAHEVALGIWLSRL